MPRSNKKKWKFKPSLDLQPQQDLMDLSIILNEEKSQMISRAIASGQKHGINLKHGTSNPGLGDCAFEAIIQNNNDRSCYQQKFQMSANHYRKIWVTDMANRTVDNPT